MDELNAKQVPLIELLSRIPPDSRLAVDDGPHSTRYYSVGALCHQAAAELKQAQAPVTSETSDGYHTFRELYEFRKAYNAALFNELAANGKCLVHKSLRHHDGELCFGGGWFIVVAILSEGQISNHYELADWDLFRVPAVDKALFEFDGHTGADVIKRLCAHKPQGTRPLSDNQIRDLMPLDNCWQYEVGDDEAISFARKIENSHGIGEVK